MKRLFTKASFGLGMLMVMANKALAQGNDFFSNPQGGTGSVNAATGLPLGDAIAGILNWFLGILGLITVAMFIYAGVLMVISQGNQEQYDKGKKILLYAAIGLIIIILSWTIVQFVISALTN